MTVSPLLAIALVVVGAACSADEPDRASREDCARLRDHVAALTITESSANMSPEQAAGHRANLAASGGDAYIEECTKSRSPEFVKCALTAKTLDGLERCRQAR